VLVIVVVLLAIGGDRVGVPVPGDREARSLPLNRANFSRLVDGTYHGLYEGGMYKWRRNECDVTVTNGKVTISSSLPARTGQGECQGEMLYERVIVAQSLQVDTISGATLTGKAYLQCVENALLQRSNKIEPQRHEGRKRNTR